ncbi:hypothetical protein CLAFUW4_03073 [Fulvia fulva]|nr:hypothetical protein CLAFUR4_03066 [Fulvia fulva]KAK4633411.1 hypothetical protein CLAFUR0_03069 [Fulvia fulva]WPV11999.1 hypothetical protein CLAFUW4_03073 [Fulvia fulva]WPV26273.1 hypothetical protein CLAFUW7_03070 [Fulvia fulva]
MGITDLWTVLGQGEVHHIADFAADHFKRHKRPLRIAVDEACWRFTNLSDEQVRRIREDTPNAKPMEKTINPLADIQAVETQCPIAIRVGRAAFGCQTLNKKHKGDSKRPEQDYIRVYRADTIARELELDANSFVLFAVLVGGDYHKPGLPGCGAGTARKVAKTSKGLAKALVEASDHQIPAWKALLANAIRSVDIPPDFPNMKALNGYRRPAVSTPDECRNIHRLRSGWDIKFDQAKARLLLHENYQLDTRDYLKHFGCVFLVRRLARIQPSQREENLRYNVKLKPTRAIKSADGVVQLKTEAKITYAASLLVDNDPTTKSPEEDWTKHAAKDGTPYNPTENIEGEVLRCFLEHGLPPGTYDAPVKPKKSRAKSVKAMEADEQISESNGGVADDNIAGQAQPATTSRKRKRPTKSHAEDVAQSVAPKKRSRSSNNDSGGPKANRTGKGNNDAAGTPSPPPMTFKIPAAMNIGADVVDLCDESESEDTARQTESDLFTPPASTPASASKMKSASVPVYRPLRPLALSQEAKEAQVAKKSLSQVATQLQQVKVKATGQKARDSDAKREKRTAPRESWGAADRPISQQISTPAVPVAASAHQAHTSARQPHGVQKYDVLKVTKAPVPMAETLVPGETITPGTLRELRAAAFSRKIDASKLDDIHLAASVVPKPPVAREVIDLT